VFKRLFLGKVCVRRTGSGGGIIYGMYAFGIVGQKEWLKKNLLVAMDIRRVEYPGGFLVFSFVFCFFFFMCVRSHPRPFNPIHRHCHHHPLALPLSTSSASFYIISYLLHTLASLMCIYLRCMHNKNNFERFNGRKLYRGFIFFFRFGFFLFLFFF
jgi:hypothetical protein